MAIHLLGIRHHGVGSAKNVRAMLQQIQPDIILVEGPPEMDTVVQWIGAADLQPPVAALCYDEALPQRAAFYPFSGFSPEWQAMLYAHQHKIPVRMMDLPLSIAWQMRYAEPPADAEVTPDPETVEAADFIDFMPTPRDPIAHFAHIAGYKNSELWWEHQFEQQYHADQPATHFEAVLLMMQTLRNAGIASSMDAENTHREAYMSQIIRKAQNELYQNIVVVCGAWHAPALLDLKSTEKAHAQILKKLPKSKIKVKATWVPWTNNRLSFASGYGAGITSPGWYHHLWEHPNDEGQRWLTKVAHLFREKKMDISTAHVIEAFRLTQSLAALRNLPRPGLIEMNEATTTVMCMGDTILLELVHKELIVGNILGNVPEGLPKLPLQADFEDIVRKLRIPLSAEKKEKALNLREENDLKRSIFFYRLQVLGITWARPISSNSKGTFKEVWELHWNPEMLISLIEMGIWGNTVELAATNFLQDKAKRSLVISELSAMISQAIPAELFTVIEDLLYYINQQATVSSDIAELMAALIPLAELGRYGNVRKSDLEAVNKLIDGLVVRISIGLPNATYGLDDDTAQKMFDLIRKVNDALRVLERADLSEQWHHSLMKIAEKDGIPPVIAGCTCRLLFDAHKIERSETARQVRLALSYGHLPTFSAAWLEGFLKGSGMILLYDDVLWNLLHTWVAELSEDAFVQLMPIMRRTFSRFETGERKKLGEKAKKGTILFAESNNTEAFDARFDPALAELALPFTAKLLGLKHA